MVRIHIDEMFETLTRVFQKYKYPPSKAALLARIHTDSTRDGVNSHGINRVMQFLEYVEEGYVDIAAEAQKVTGFGSMEQWDGQFGAGIINAVKCTDRAIELAKANGIGLVALRNTNHWMRAGTYGRRAADAGCICICFTNTQPNMPPWGGKESRLGNNPLVIAIPREAGHVVLDMAVSQFSFGKIHSYKLKGEQLPYYGGWDESFQLSKDPERILKKERGLPIGYWKGSALSMVLDMLATLLSAGDSTAKISARGKESGISQVFLCLDPNKMGSQELQSELLTEIIQYTKDVSLIDDDQHILFPGERTIATRTKNSKDGIPVDENIWNEISMLAKS